MKLTINKALQQAVTAHKEGKLEEAERFYREILQAQPTHPDANHNLGVLELSKNKSAAALPLFKTAVEANPNIEQFWISYINMLIKENQFEEAELYSRKAIELKPEFVTAHFNLGAILQVLSRLDEAEASYKKAIDLKHDFRKANAGLGYVLMLKGQHKEGLEQLRLGNGVIIFEIDNWLVIQ